MHGFSFIFRPETLCIITRDEGWEDVLAMFWVELTEPE